MGCRAGRLPLRVSRGARVVARRHLERVQRDQGDRRTRDDGRDLSRLRPCTARRLAAVRPLRRRRHGRRTGTLVFPLPRRRAARVPDVDPCAAADRESGHPSGPCVDRPRSTRLLRRHRRRTQLAILLPVLGLVLLGRVWRSERIRDWRSTWTRSDWIGAGTLLVGVTVGVSAVLGHRSFSWYVATGFSSHECSNTASGLSVRSRSESAFCRSSRAHRAGVAARGAAGRAPSNVRHAERRRDLILRPVHRGEVRVPVNDIRDRDRRAKPDLSRSTLFTGTALVLERRRPTVLATALATAVAVYLVKETPYALDRYPNYEAHGLAIAAFANRIPKWPAETIETVFVLVALAAGGALLAFRLVRCPCGGRDRGDACGRRADVDAHDGDLRGERRARLRPTVSTGSCPSRRAGRRPHGRAADCLVGQGITDANPIYQLEFWNRSIEYFMGMDEAPRTGADSHAEPRQHGRHARARGSECPVRRRGGEVALAAPRVATVGGMDLYRLDRKPVRLRETRTGVAPDGWMGEHATSHRYDAGLGRGFVKVNFSRQAPASRGSSPRACGRGRARGGERRGPAVDRPRHRDRFRRARRARSRRSSCACRTSRGASRRPSTARSSRTSSTRTSATGARSAPSSRSSCPVGLG